MHRSLRFRLAAPLAATLLLAVGAAAQTGNQSDIGFPNVTGSGAVGGHLNGPGLRGANELFVHDALATRFRNAAVGCGVRSAARAYADSAAAAPRDPRSAAVYALLAGSPSADAGALAAALSRGAPAAAGEARALANALRGLYAPPTGCPDDAEEFAEAPRWEEAFQAYRAFLRALPDEALAPPAPELLAVHDALENVLVKSTRRRERR